MAKGKYLMKSERDAKARQAREADARIQVLLNMFGNYILEVRGVDGKVTSEEISGFVRILGKN